MTTTILLLTLLTGAPAKDIVDTAVSADSFKTLVTAVKQAGLVPALKSKGPFTVFAPVDSAFAKLPKGTVATLLKRENRDQLQAILKFHVVPGRLTAADLFDRASLTTLQGEALPLSLKRGRLTVKGAGLLATDIECTNGIIHVVDSVLLPQTKRIPEVAQGAGQFKTLLAAVKAAGLADKLLERGPFTVFAPTDAAFKALPSGAVADLLKPENKSKLVTLLARHVVSGRISAATALRAGKARTLAGDTLEIEGVRNGLLQVAGASVISPDVAASNGVIHVIDKVLLPPAPARGANVTALLELAIDRGVPLFNKGQPEACAAIYEVAARAALMTQDGLTPTEVRMLEVGLRAANGSRDARTKAWALREAFDSLLASVARPVKAEPTGFVSEAELPRGFPRPGPVGEVVVKEYPQYRAARAEGGRWAFGTLFNHIKKNKIAMTAPVEMAMDGDMNRKNMAFLYASTELGKTGRDGRVDVVDLEPMRVLSYGIMGRLSNERLAEAKRAIERELKAKGWQTAGDFRLMGYNSPMIPQARRFHELQVPVTAAP